MFKINSLSVKNFMSVGNATQAIGFDRKDLTLVLGENLDLGGDDSGARNGTGKTTIINALSYALYGNALTNIKKDNLVNKTNNKNMLVTVNFECNGTRYRIERGRKPNILKFYADDHEYESNDDNSQGDSRETQLEIEKILKLSHDMFKHIVALNTYTEPFLSLKSNDQRNIIEQLLGITLLSEKADLLKEQLKITKDSITAEEFRIKAVQDANKRIQEQIDSLKRRQVLWLQKKSTDILNLQSAYDQLATIDIDQELLSHKNLTVYVEQKRKKEEHDLNLSRLKKELDKEEKLKNTLITEIDSLNNHKCHACGQDFHDAQHSIVLESKLKLLEESNKLVNTLAEEIRKVSSVNITVINKPITFYEEERDAIEHQTSLASILTQLSNKQHEVDPYSEQIAEMNSQALQTISYDYINELGRVKEHQDFLLKLLTNKDSFIRKQIIDQNLSYLNTRLSFYLNKIGLPHVVKFQNDLSVSIEEYGRELDFDNLSRGERNRLILSLSWSFRDVWETLYHPINLLFIDELIDSGMDSSGVENSLGILKKMARDGNRSVWLVSHKDELTARVNNIMTVVKENGFTNYNNDVEVV